MTDKPEQDERPQARHAGGELIIPIGALGFTLYYFSSIWNSPWTAQVNAVLVGSLLITCLVILAVRIARERALGMIDFRFDDLISPKALIPTRIAFALLTIAYLVALSFDFGFTLSTFVFLAGGFMLLHGISRWKIDIPLAATMALIGYVVFIILFDTRFPKGAFETWMVPVVTWAQSYFEAVFL